MLEPSTTSDQRLSAAPARLRVPVDSRLPSCPRLDQVARTEPAAVLGVLAYWLAGSAESRS